jgi:hypothetical protein
MNSSIIRHIMAPADNFFPVYHRKNCIVKRLACLVENVSEKV